MLATALSSSLTAPLLLANAVAPRLNRELCSPAEFLMPAFEHWAQRPGPFISSLEDVARFSQARLFLQAAADLPYVDRSKQAQYQRSIANIREQLYQDCVDVVMQPAASPSAGPLLNLVHIWRDRGVGIEDVYLATYQDSREFRLPLNSSRRAIRKLVTQLQQDSIVKTIAHRDPHLFAAFDFNAKIIDQRIKARETTKDKQARSFSAGAGVSMMWMPPLRWLLWDMLKDAVTGPFRAKPPFTAETAPASRLAEAINALSYRASRPWLDLHFGVRVDLSALATRLSGNLLFDVDLRTNTKVARRSANTASLLFPPLVAKDIKDPTLNAVKSMLHSLQKGGMGVIVSENPTTIQSAITYLESKPRQVARIRYSRVPLSGTQLDARGIHPPMLTRGALSLYPDDYQSRLPYGTFQWGYPLLFERR